MSQALIPAATRVKTDFPNYFLAARLHHDGISLARAYDWTWFQRQKDHAGIDWGVVRFTPLTPFSALVLSPLATRSIATAKAIWTVVDAAILVGVIALLHASTSLGLRRVALLTFLTVVPLRNDFEFGQQYVLLTFLLALTAWLRARGRPVASGVTLALAAALKLYPALFAIFLALKGRWRELLALLAGLGALVGAGCWLFGVETLRVYATEVLPRALAGEGNDPYFVGFNSTATLLRRLFVYEHELNPHPLVHAPVLYALLQPAIVAGLVGAGLWRLSPAWRPDEARRPIEFAAFLALLLAVSTSSSTYHFCPLVVSTVLAVDFLLRSGQTRTALALVALHALVSAPWNRFAPASPDGWRALLGTPRLYATLAYWGLLVHALRREHPPISRSRWEAAGLGAACAALAVFGMTSGLRRARSWSEDSSRPVLAEGADVRVASNPRPAGDDVYFVGLAAEGFVLQRARRFPFPGERARHDVLATGRGGVDLFHPALAEGRADGWVESAGRASRIARWTSDGARFAAALATEIDDGEAPSASADGRTLAFLREVRGRGSLWLAAADAATGRCSSPREIAGAGYDVLESAFFPDGRVVFAAQPEGAPRLFVASPDGADIRPLDASPAKERYPSPSPDGRWLAYDAEDQGAWRLHIRDATGRDRTLTPTLCNSIAPAWSGDARALVYASDCRRDLGDTTLREIVAESFDRGATLD